METKKLFCIILGAILLFGSLLGTAQAVDAASGVNVTWDANNGKVEGEKTKVTTIKKGTKINKLPKAPKYTGYTFKGWYTKKTGGTKVTKSMKPSKKVTYYAQWKKKPLSLIGRWRLEFLDQHAHSHGDECVERYEYIFYTNGKFVNTYNGHEPSQRYEGKYSTSNGNLLLGVTGYGVYTHKYKLGSDKEGNYLQIEDNKFKKVS
jgi:uncharacterized repeat protein (TIGR02543 family)